MSLNPVLLLVVVELGLLGMVLGFVLPVNRRVGGITAGALLVAVIGAVLEGALVLGGSLWATQAGLGEGQLAAALLGMLVAEMLVPFTHALALAVLVWAIGSLDKSVRRLEQAS